MLDPKVLLTRTLSGVLYVGIIVGCCLMGDIALMVMAMLFGVVACVELFNMVSKAPQVSRRKISLIIDVFGVIMLAGGQMIWTLPIWVALMLARFVAEMYMNDPQPMKSLATSALSQLYIGFPLLCMTGISAIKGSAMPVLAIFIMIWCNDTGAFLVGSMCGRHKMWERLSPKKTWEGFAGGMLFSVGAALLMGAFASKYFGMDTFFGHFNLYFWSALGVLAAVFSTWGDLFESMIKRSYNLKDSGNLIPGHGGILDRIDSMLFVMPAAFLFIFIVDFMHWFI